MQTAAGLEIGRYADDLFSVELSKSPDDLGQVVRIEKKCWPLKDAHPGGAWQATEEKFGIRQEIDALYVSRHLGRTTRLDVNGNGARVREGEIVGHVTAYKTAWMDAYTVKEIVEESSRHPVDWPYIVSKGSPSNFYLATRNGYIKRDGESVYDPNSNVMHLISFNVPPPLRGLINHGDRQASITDILMEGVKYFAKNSGVIYIVGITTLPELHNYSYMTPDEYVRARRENGTRLDPNLRRYERQGATVVCAAPGYMWDDKKSLGNGALVIIPVQS